MTDAHNIRLVVADMDGTFLRRDKSMSPRNKEAVRLLHSHGIGFTFCTGRIATQTFVYCKELEQQTPILTSQGAVVWDHVENRPIHAKYMDTDEAIWVADFCHEGNYDNVVLTHGPVYCTPDSGRLWNYRRNNELASAIGVPLMDLRELSTDHEFFRDLQISKMLIYEHDQVKFHRARQFLDSLEFSGYTVSDPGLLDITVAGENKGTGVLHLSEIMGVSPEEICVFGDYYNDLDMFREAGLSVAMGNAPEEVKAAADMVAPTNEEDGFAIMVESFFH